MGIVYEHGINDMYRGWYIENEWNKQVYQKWNSMLRRVYSDEYHQKHPTYIKCSCQLELHWLSYFVEHITEIEGYDYEKFMNGELILDKDIKSNGKNKEYSIENCMFVSSTENSIQAVKTREHLQGENHPNWGKSLSEETRKKISEALKGKFVGENNPNYGSHKLKGENNPMYGKQHSEEARKKMSENHADYSGGKHPHSKKIIQYDKQWNLIKIWDCIMDVERELKINHSDISRCCRGKLKTTGGFIWRYVEE